MCFSGQAWAEKGSIRVLIAGDVKISKAERFYCVLTWVFLLRANSETTHLRRAAGSAEFNAFEPLACEGVVGLVDNCLVVRLRSRKTKVGGESIVRHCVCKTTESRHTYRQHCVRSMSCGNGLLATLRRASACSHRILTLRLACGSKSL